jgi:hypothetical protein
LERRRRLSVDAIISIVLFAAVAGHVAGFWQIPRVGEQSAGPAASFNPRSITVAYARPVTGGVSPWNHPDLDRIMRRFVERWSEATLGRSQIIVMEETELRDVLIVFNNKRVIPAAEARSIKYAGGRLRLIEVYADALAFGVDVEFTATTLLHELGHVLGCCTGPGTAGGHWVGLGGVCPRILCTTHGNARTFSEEELQQMGLGR